MLAIHKSENSDNTLEHWLGFFKISIFTITDIIRSDDREVLIYIYVYVYAGGSIISELTTYCRPDRYINVRRCDVLVAVQLTNSRSVCNLFSRKHLAHQGRCLIWIEVILLLTYQFLIYTYVL